MNIIANSNIDKRLELNVETVRKLWSKTYNSEGRPDWSHIFCYYHDNIVFQDCIQRLEGIDNFKAMCDRLTKRSGSLRMDLGTIMQQENTIILEWTMWIAFKKYPETPVYGITKLTIHEDGRISEQRDYYDLWGDIFNGIPKWKKIYRKWMCKHYG